MPACELSACLRARVSSVCLCVCVCVFLRMFVEEERDEIYPGFIRFSVIRKHSQRVRAYV